MRADEHDDLVFVENAISQKKTFSDKPRVGQLTQNSWQSSPYTREDVAIDLLAPRGRTVGRMERYRTPVRPGRYHERRHV